MNNPTKNKIVVAKAELCSFTPKPQFKAAMTGIPIPAISLKLRRKPNY